MESFNLVCIEDRLWCVTTPTGMGAYDFEFERYFSCRHVWNVDQPVLAVARMGAAQDYARRFEELAELGIRLIHSPEDYARSSELPAWYSSLVDLTPRSLWFEHFPTVEEVERHFRWPVFIKGQRQTNRHRADQCVIRNPDHLLRLQAQWRGEPILAWQRVVCREFIPLRPVAIPAPGNLQRSFEFRTFCWHGRCVGIGPYWIGESYALSNDERQSAVELAETAARRMALPFLVVDVAQARDGRWWVIEINDGQDSGYAGVNPMLMWRNVLDIAEAAGTG